MSSPDAPPPRPPAPPAPAPPPVAAPPPLASPPPLAAPPPVASVSDAPSGPRRPPLWVWPAIGLGLVYPIIASSARSDVELLERMPEPKVEALKPLERFPGFQSWLLVGVAIALAVVFGLVRLGITDVWTESMVFMALALALGIASPAAAWLMLVIFIPLDFIATVGSGTLEPFLPALLGRAVTWWLLWLLAVAIPLVARALPGATMASGTPADPNLRRILGYASGVIAVVVLLALWIGAAPFLIRPVFIWSDWYGTPTVPAIEPIQTSGQLLIVVGALMVVLVTFVRDRLGVLDTEAVELSEPSEMEGLSDEPLLPDEGQFLVRIISHAFAVIALGGLVSGALDVALLFGTLLVGRPVAGWLLRRAPLLVLALARIPWVVRFLLGFGVTYVVGLVVTGALTGPQFGSEFFAIVLSIAVGLFVLQVLMEVDEAADDVALERREAAVSSGPPAVSPGGTVASALLVAVALGGWLVLAMPAAVSADNCSSLSDCPSTGDAQAGAAAGAAAVVAVTAVAAALADRSPEGRRRRANLRRRRKAQGKPSVLSRFVERGGAPGAAGGGVGSGTPTGGGMAGAPPTGGGMAAGAPPGGGMAAGAPPGGGAAAGVPASGIGAATPAPSVSIVDRIRDRALGNYDPRLIRRG